MSDHKTPEDHQVTAYKLLRQCGVDQTTKERIITHMSEACRLSRIQGREEAAIAVMLKSTQLDVGTMASPAQVMETVHALP